MKKIFLKLNKFAFLCLLPLFSNIIQANPLEIVGTGDGMQILRVLADAFEQANPGDKVVIPPSIGSSAGIQAVKNKQFRLGRIARPLKKNELSFGLTVVPWARSPVVFYGHSNLKDTSITFQQLLDIYAGKIKNWKEINGVDEKIRIIYREETDSSLRVIKNGIKGGD